MQNHMAEGTEKFEVETPRIWRHSSRHTYLVWNAGMGIICGKAECMWRLEEVVKAACSGSNRIEYPAEVR